MKTTDFTTSFWVSQSPEETFEAITHVRKWWTGEPGIKGRTSKLGDEFTYRYEPHHYSKQRITELIPGKKVVWEVTDSQIHFVEDKNEWTGSIITFDLSKKGETTQVRFSHLGLVPGIECYDACSKAWESYINTSLRNLIISPKAQLKVTPKRKHQTTKKSSNE